MQRNSALTFSIIIPSFNEGDDVRLSIESAVAQEYPPLEVLVVDDSTDRTPEIVREYASRGVRLIDGPRRGCCGARNLGMRSAAGDIIVLLNADVILPPDFLSRLELLYRERSADYVLVESRVVNTESLWARFVEAQHETQYRTRDDIEWTEGFSCRKSAALSVGLIPGEFSLTFCRDWLLGKRLGEAGFTKVIDRTIVVTHRAPGAFAEYYRVRKARGRFSSLMQHYLYEYPLALLAAKLLVKDVLLLLKYVTVVAVLARVGRIAARSARPLADFFPFLLAYAIQEYARVSGEWQGFLLAVRRGESVRCILKQQ